MSAPVTERTRGNANTRGRGATIPAQRRGSADRSEGRGAATAEPTTARRSSQRKAYARRDDRLRRAASGWPTGAPTSAGRPQFVLLVMTLLAVALVATLWLSTAAAADSYRLEAATAEADMLGEQAEQLHREVAVLESAPELARRAAELGMTPVQDPARLVVAPDGTVSVVGEPRAAVGEPPAVPLGPGDGRSRPGGPTGASGGDGAGGTDLDSADSGSADGDSTGGTSLAAPAGDPGTALANGAGPDPDGGGRDGTSEDGADRVTSGGGGTDGG